MKVSLPYDCGSSAFVCLVPSVDVAGRQRIAWVRST
jgi:hypothetical protein